MFAEGKHSRMLTQILPLGPSYHLWRFLMARNPLGSHTQDGDGRQQLPILEEALTVHVGSGVIGIGVIGGALHTGPAPHSAAPAHNAVQNTRVLLPKRRV